MPLRNWDKPDGIISTGEHLQESVDAIRELQRVKIRRLLPSDLVRAYQCPCGSIMPPRDEFSHKVQCKHPASNAGQHIAVAHPRLAVLHTSRFPIVIEGLETPDELAAMAAVECPYPPAVTVSDSGILADAKN